MFSSGHELVGGKLLDMRASYSHLSAWHLQGWYEQSEEVGESSLRRDLLFVMRVYLLLACHVGALLTRHRVREQAQA